MGINRVKVSNFKSFDSLDVELNNFNLLIGSNASGKSNFIKIFAFLRDINNYGLDNAISMQGGVEFLRNINILSSDQISIEIFATHESAFSVRSKSKGLIGIKPYEITYKFSLKLKGKLLNYEIGDDNLNFKCHFVKLEKIKSKIEEKEKIGEGEISISKIRKNLKIDFQVPKEIDFEKDSIIPHFSALRFITELKEEKLLSRSLLLQPPFSFMPIPWGNNFTSISIFDFDPKLPKRATQITGKAELEDDGANLAIFLKNILENREKKRKFLNLVRELLPFVNKLEVEKIADKSLLFKILEIYSIKRYIPASLLSDGTINIISLILAIFFDERQITIIEEPERNIHPYLISKIISMMREASEGKQIITTSHNPEVVKHVDIKDLLLISRNNQGYSTVSRPFEKDEVKTFLENEIGIEELFAQNLLDL